jgi:hypothetical protein
MKKMPTIRFWLPFILTMTVFYWSIEPIYNFITAYDLPINAVYWIFLFTTTPNQLIYFLGVAILFSDLPFKDDQQPFLLIRTGKMRWIMSQMIYIVISCFVYLLITILFSLIMVFPKIGFNFTSWGKIISTIASTSLDSEFGIMSVISPDIVNKLSPLQAGLYTFGSVMLISVGICLLIFTVNLRFNTRSGAAFAFIPLFFALFAPMANGTWIYGFSPVTWSSINATNIYSAYNPGIPRIFISLTLIVAVFVVCLTVCGRKKSKIVIK